MKVTFGRVKEAIGWPKDEDTQLLLDHLEAAGLTIVATDQVGIMVELNKTLDLLSSMQDRRGQSSLMKQVTEQILALSK